MMNDEPRDHDVRIITILSKGRRVLGTIERASSQRRSIGMQADWDSSARRAGGRNLLLEPMKLQIIANFTWLFFAYSIAWLRGAGRPNRKRQEGRQQHPTCCFDSLS